MHEKPCGYDCLFVILGFALQILDQGQSDVGKERMGISYSKMHRELCVLEKQDWIPFNALQRVWNIRAMKLVEIAMTEMERVGVAQCDRRELGAEILIGLRVHDLTLVFAETEAKKNEGMEWWCEKLVDGYACDGHRQKDWQWGAEIKDDVFFRSICRLALSAG